MPTNKYILKYIMSSTGRSGEIIDSYKRDYGLKDFEKVRYHVANSKHSANLVAQSVEKNAIPTGEDFVASVMSHWRYSFSSPDKVEVASIILFTLWLNHVEGLPLNLTMEKIKQIEKEIIEKCTAMRFK